MFVKLSAVDCVLECLFWDMFSLCYFSQVNRRGAAPEGGGEVVFTCPCRQKLRPVQLTEQGKVKRIRGIAYPLTNRMLSLNLQTVNTIKCYSERACNVGI